MSKILEPYNKLLLISAQANEAETKERLDFLYGKKEGESFVESLTTEITSSHRNTDEDDVFQEKISAIESDKYQHVIIATHGEVKKRGEADDEKAELAEDRVGETHYGIGLDILKQIKSLKEKGIQDFHIVTCNGGALIHDIAKNAAELKGTNITIYSSSKYGTTKSIMDFIGKTFHEILASGAKNYDEISAIIIGNRLKFSAETIVFSSISPEGELSAVKFRNPKEASQNLAKKRDQLEAFANHNNLIDYFIHSAFAPIYLNNVDAKGDRVALAINSTALTKSLKTVEALKDLSDLQKEEFFKDQLKYSLSKAATNRKLQTVEKIIEISSRIAKGEDVLNYQDGVGSSVLMWASLSGNLDIVKSLLSAKKVDINQVNIARGTALMLAILNGEAAVILELLKNGASVNEPVNIYGGSSLTYALMLSVDESDSQATEKSDKKKTIVKSLLEKLAEEKITAEKEGRPFEIKGDGVKDGETLAESLQNYVQNLLEKGDDSQAIKSLMELSKKIGLFAAESANMEVAGENLDKKKGESFVEKLGLQNPDEKPQSFVKAMEARASAAAGQTPNLG